MDHSRLNSGILMFCILSACQSTPKTNKIYLKMLKIPLN